MVSRGDLRAGRPLYVIFTHDASSITLLGYGAPFQIAPFVYAAAAYGLGRVSSLRRADLRRFLLAGGSVMAVAFPVLSIFPVRGWYAKAIGDAFATRHEIGVLAGIRKVPRGVSVTTDPTAFPFLAHRALITLYPYGLGAGVLPKVDGVFFDRNYHPAWVFAADAARLAAAGFHPVYVSADAAYFARRPGKLAYDDV